MGDQKPEGAHRVGGGGDGRETPEDCQGALHEARLCKNTCKCFLQASKSSSKVHGEVQWVLRARRQEEGSLESQPRARRSVGSPSADRGARGPWRPSQPALLLKRRRRRGALRERGERTSPPPQAP